MSDDFDILLYGFLAVIAAVVIALVVTSCGSTSTAPLSGAEKAVTALCADHGGVVYYDVQDQNVLVYACNDTHKLQLYSY